MIGKAVRAEQVPVVIDQLARHYLSIRKPRESFIEAVERVGAESFKAALIAEELAPA